MAINLQKLEFSVGLSDPEEHLLHREILGRKKSITGLDSEVYSAHFSTQRVAFQSIIYPSLTPDVPTSPSLAIASVGSIQLDALVSQLTAPFMSRLAVRRTRGLGYHSGAPTLQFWPSGSKWHPLISRMIGNRFGIPSGRNPANPHLLPHHRQIYVPRMFCRPRRNGYSTTWWSNASLGCILTRSWAVSG